MKKKEYPISDTQSFSQERSTSPPLEEYEENVTYDVESPFTTIPVRLTLDCIIDQIYMKKKVTPVCTKSIFTKLHINLAM